MSADVELDDDDDEDEDYSGAEDSDDSIEVGYTTLIALMWVTLH